MGKLIVIEGIDGSGKSTQYKKLRQRLENEGRSFRSLVFPRYDNPSSSLIRMYLGGEFGADPGDVNAFAASSFYSVDRYASYKTEWEDYYLAGGVLLSDRYTTSNAVHQGAKLPAAERAAYFSWLEDFEFEKLGLPRPDRVIYLNIDVETSLRQMKARQDATGTRGDIHETHADYLRSCIESGQSACAHYGWTRIDCIREGVMRSIDEIHQEIYSAVAQLF